ncbi:hypothetical protein ACC699_39270, partial [Rhizobium ruizarguesonis]
QPWPAELLIADGGLDMAKRTEDRLLRQDRALVSSGALPISYVRRLWPIVRQIMDMNHVPVRRRPLAIGMAIELAFAIDEQRID